MDQKAKLTPAPARARRITKSVAQMRKCDVCGQTFDLRDLDHADRHNGQPHEPLAKFVNAT